MKKQLVLLICLLTSCIKSEQPTVVVASSLPQKISYLALGDSYTAGTSVMSAERWCNQLAVGLGVQNLDVIAQSGYVTGDLINAIKTANPRTDYGLVSLLIGVNNQFRRQDIAKYRIELRELLNITKRLANGNAKRVFVLSMPDWGLTPSGAFLDRNTISKEIDDYNKVAEEECKLMNIKFINITDLSRKALVDISLVSGDDLHYSGKMYKLWVERVAPVVQTMLNQ
jgi:acyl-CoA thioesterase I